MQQQSKLTGNRSWVKEEDDMLLLQMNAIGKSNWESVAKNSGLKRTANSCRLRWENHLKPRARPGKLTDEEKLLILEFRSLWGGRNCWSKIAKHLLPGRRDNDVKNFWHTLAKRAKREGRDVDNDACLKRVELMETIEAAGKFSMDYSSSICSVAYNKLKYLLPDIAVAGGGAVTDIGALSSASNIGAADAVTSGNSVEFGQGSFKQVPGAGLDSAFTESNQGCYHMQEFLALVEQHEQPMFFDLDGDLTEFDQTAFSVIEEFGF